MNHKHIYNELERNKQVFTSLLEGLSNEVYTWKQSDEKWSLLEIICHLCDEEREDFRFRLNHVLTNPDEPMPSINPPVWVKERNYAGQDYETKIAEFAAERDKSSAWLNTLGQANWSNAYKHPKLGPLSAEMFLANWLAHDYLHIRQITKLKYDYLAAASGQDLRYAGGW
jgi:hypothetical protein